MPTNHELSAHLADKETLLINCHSSSWHIQSPSFPVGSTWTVEAVDWAPPSSSCLAILFPQQLFAGSRQLGRNCFSAVNVRGLFIENAFLIHELFAFPSGTQWGPPASASIVKEAQLTALQQFQRPCSVCDATCARQKLFSLEGEGKNAQEYPVKMCDATGACSPDTPLRAFASPAASAPAPSRNYHLRVPTVCLHTGVPPHQGELLEAPAHLPGTSPPDASGIANKEGKDPWLPTTAGRPSILEVLNYPSKNGIGKIIG